MLNREHLETFATIVELGSFERASSALNVTPGAVSQRIKSLEEAVAAVLLLREKPVKATRRGEVLLRHVKALRALEGSTLHDLAPGGQTLAPIAAGIAVNADSLASWFAPIVGHLLGRGRVALEVISDDQDFTFQRLSRGEVIGCVSSEPVAIPGFVAEPLGSMVYMCLASPSFANRYFPNGLTLPGVLAAPAILFDRKDALHDTFLQRVFGFKVQRYICHHIPAPGLLLDIIVAAAGYGLVPMPQAKELLASGSLVDLAPDHRVHVPLYWHHWQTELPFANEITALVMERAAQFLVPDLPTLN